MSEKQQIYEPYQSKSSFQRSNIFKHVHWTAIAGCICTIIAFYHTVILGLLLLLPRLDIEWLHFLPHQFPFIFSLVAIVFGGIAIHRSYKEQWRKGKLLGWISMLVGIASLVIMVCVTIVVLSMLTSLEI